MLLRHDSGLGYAQPMELTRDGVRAWLRDILARTGDTPTALAKKAGIAQTTLTRFLNDADGAGPMLTLRTVSKIAHVTGSAPAGFTPPPSHGTPAGLEETDAAPFDVPDGEKPLEAALAALMTGRNAADVWKLQTHALVHAGFHPGDLLIVDLGITAVAGDVVCAQHYKWAAASAETIFRIYEPPYLVAAGLEPELRRPLVVDGERVVIKGVVIAMVRPRLA